MIRNERPDTTWYQGSWSYQTRLGTRVTVTMCANGVSSLSTLVEHYNAVQYLHLHITPLIIETLNGSPDDTTR